jgi:hypothetical protein
MKLPFTIYDSRFTICKKSSESAVAGRRAGPAGNHKSSIVNRESERGIALIITLILLSVTLIMAVAFLAISRRERGSVVTSTDAATARLAADAALANAEAQIIANVFATTNPYNYGLLVSTNYQNSYGYVPNSQSPTNVNYDYRSDGTALNVQDFLQNVANLYYLPRAPVFVSTNSLGSNEFRFYLDLNRNGKFEDSGLIPETNNLGLATGNKNFQVGDPQWIGVLERPDAPHGPNNKFLSRYAFIAMPVGNELDLNYIHNQALHGNSTNGTLGEVNPPPAGDVFFRNQGVGSWEINLAAFLADLNTNVNEWGNDIGLTANYYRYNELGGIANQGNAFDDARALLAYRYNNTFGSLVSFSTLFPNYSLPGSVDIFPLGAAMTGTAVPFYNYSLNNLWPGADSPNHFFALTSDLFDTNKSSVAFVNRLNIASATNSTYDRYTFYRMLAQLGTDSTAESGKMNLNYDNLDIPILKNRPVVAGPPATTNFLAWTPIDFFTNAADRMLRLYTTNWFQGSASGYFTNYITYFTTPETNWFYTAPSNYLATYYGIHTNYFSYVDEQGRYIWNAPSGFGLTNVPYFGITNQIPAFGITNIPVYYNGQFVYSSAIQRVLQLAANIYDASTNSFFPSVFRPLFERDYYDNIFIAGYTNLSSNYGLNTVADANDPQLALPYDITQLTNYLTSYTLMVDKSGFFVNVYGVPWIIGAKKGFPNFNEFAMNNTVQITRALQIAKPNTNFPPKFSYTNVAYTFGIGNSLGIEFWNSYTNIYAGPVQIVVNDTLSMSLSNGPPFTRAPFVYSNIFYIFTNSSVVNWPGFTQPGSYVYQTTNVTFMTNLTYQFARPTAFLPVNTAGWETNIQYLPLLPQLYLVTAHRLQTYMLDGHQVIDYGQFTGPDSIRDLNAEIQTFGNSASYQNMWTTNLSASGLPISIKNQILASRDDPSIPLNRIYWNNQTLPPAYEIDGFNVFMGGSPTALPLPLPNSQVAAFNAYVTNLIRQVPYTPTVTSSLYTTWQANDPLVHYLSPDLNFSELDMSPPTGLSTNYLGSTNFFGALPNIGQLNVHYQPWGIVYKTAGSDNNPYNYAYKDPLATNSGTWDFPTNKFPTVGWLGRVHRGTPWQTVFLKATNILNWVGNGANGLTTWTNWTGDVDAFDAANARPTQDALLFDIFSAAPNDNAAHGQLSINVAADTNNPAAGLAAWSALFSGIAVPTSLTNSYTVINPAGVAGVPVPTGPPSSPYSPYSLGYLVQNGTNGINDVRANFRNPDGLVGTFEHVGNILAVPALTEKSPFLVGQNFTNGVSDALMEWLPQQAMSLLRTGNEDGGPRYVIYCYGQTLKPAPNGIVTGSTQFGMVTNYQVVAETATRAVVQFRPSVTTDASGTHTNYNATVEQFNPLPPD